MTSNDRTKYLARLELTDALPPTLETLRQMHRAHVARIPYDNLSIMLGRPDSAEPSACVARAAAGERLGYCFQQNAAFEWLLRDIGFAVSRRAGHVWFRPEQQFDTALNHLVLVVSGLPTEENAGGHWWADAGMGEGFAEPLPLVRGDHEIDGWSFGIGAGYGAQASARPTGPAAWTYRHLAGGSLTGIVVTSRAHDQAAVDSAHASLSTDAESPFRRALTAQRVDGARLLRVKGCTYQTLTPSLREQQDLSSYDEWRAALVEDLLVPTVDVTEDEWRDLWARTLASHREWDEAGRP